MEVAGEDEEKVGLMPEELGEGGLLESLAAVFWGVNGFWRVLPASEFLWVGAGWLCSAVYVTMNIPGSDLFRSTCLRAKQPFELLHL